MSKNVYLVITDVHATYKNKRNRINYLSEVDFVFNKIEELIEKYSYDYNVNLIFLGDIIDVSFKSQDKAILYNNTMIRLDSMVDKIYSVVGNHEITYYIDNPFWTLMNRIDAPSVTSKLNKSWKPKGLMQIINVVDTLADGNVLFHFNHNIRDGVSAPAEGKYNINPMPENLIHATGIGVSETDRRDGFEVYTTGEAWFKGPLYVGGTDDTGADLYKLDRTKAKEVATIEYVDSKAGGVTSLDGQKGALTTKTLFGNSSILGTGNIDLYRHRITINNPGNYMVVLTYVSSNSLDVDSMTDLKNLIKEEGWFECTPISSENILSFYINPQTLAVRYYFYDTNSQIFKGTGSLGGTLTDSKTTI